MGKMLSKSKRRAKAKLLLLHVFVVNVVKNLRNRLAVDERINFGLRGPRSLRSPADLI